MSRTLQHVAALLLLTACLAIPEPAAADPISPVILNGGFETGRLAPWFNARDFGGIEPWTVTSSEAHSGGFSAVGVGNNELRQNFAAVATNAIAELSFWVRHPNLTFQFGQAFDLFFADGSSIERSFPVSGDQWQFFDLTNRLPANRTLVGFSLWGYNSSSPERPVTLVDDVRLAAERTPPVPEPATLMLVGTGMAAASLRARRRRPS